MGPPEKILRFDDLKNVCLAAVVNCINAKKDEKGVLLLDLSKGGKVKNSELIAVARFAIGAGWKIVAATSSGGGSRIDYDDSAGFAQYTSTFDTCVSIVSKSFTEEEASLYMKEYKIDSIWKDQIYQYTGWNPGLLSSFKYLTSKENKCFCECAAKCMRSVTRLVKLIVESVTDRDHHLFRALQDSEEFLSCMTYNEPIPMGKLVNYDGTYLGEENLAHITWLSLESFTLELNYPTLYNILCRELCKIAKVRKFYYDIPAVQGYVFEAVFLQSCKDYQIEAQEIKEGRIEGDRKNLNFTISHFQICDVIPTNLRDSCLYGLPKGHAAIDAVGVFKHADENYLVMIQVAISEYSSHESKFQDIYGDLKGQVNSIQEYYFNIGGGADKIHHSVYMYVSGKEVGSNSNVLKPNLSSLKLRSGKTLNKHVNCFVGVAMKDSFTHKEINKTLKFIEDQITTN